MSGPSELTKSSAIWAVNRGNPGAERTLDELVMAWAKDAQSGQPKYIFELGADRTGAKCGCVCYGCGRPLTAVNAAKTAWQRRPHFRHPDGAERDSCWVLTARAAALEMLQTKNQIVLPSRTLGMHIIGVSGKEYQAWATKPPERVSIRSFKPRDQVSAILSLDDGREVLVRLTGSLEADTEGDMMPSILLEVDDPGLAAVSPEKLKERLHLLVENASWCGAHWDDPQLTTQAVLEATANAEEALDFVSDAAREELPEPVTNETLLHWLTKEVLRNAQCLRVPELVFCPPRSGSGRQEGPVLERRSGAFLKLSDVQLEQNLGQIRPDVIAQYLDPVDSSSGTLLIEVTVTNKISQERVARIRKKGHAALEIDISSLGGVLTKTEFSRLVTDEIAGKRWLHHPWLTEQVDAYEARLAQMAGDRENALAKLRIQFLDAVAQHSELRVRDIATPEHQEDRKAALNAVRTLATELASWGFEAAEDETLYAYQGCILDRLLSIRDNRVVGYRVTTLWQVINAILCEKEPYFEWHTFYLTALKVYAPLLTEEHARKVSSWRSSVLRSLRDGESTYRRRLHYDSFLALLFPEMAEDLRKHLPGSPGLDRPENALAGNNPKSKAERDSPIPFFDYPRTAEGLWLRGSALEEWKRRYPEAAQAWEQRKVRHSED